MTRFSWFVTWDRFTGRYAVTADPRHAHTGHTSRTDAEDMADRLNRYIAEEREAA